MMEGYRQTSANFIAAKKLKGEAKVLLFYRTIILHLLMVFFLVTLCSASVLFLGREVILTSLHLGGNMPLLIFFALTTLGSGIGLYYFLRQEVLLKEVIAETYKLKKMAPIT